ncbi:unnamed protein product [Meloidogyne enterolobii]|uniref:Uncharacterized protein n=1 Tax=Meloidogyne enterolobii TaxID=390850 RepID=A0ACB0XKY8_MELEN
MTLNIKNFFEKSFPSSPPFCLTFLASFLIYILFFFIICVLFFFEYIFLLFFFLLQLFFSSVSFCGGLFPFLEFFSFFSINICVLCVSVLSFPFIFCPQFCAYFFAFSINCIGDLVEKEKNSWGILFIKKS